MICTFLCGAANKKRTRDLVPTNDVSNFSKKWSIDTVTIYCVFLLIVLYILSYYEKMVRSLFEIGTVHAVISLYRHNVLMSQQLLNDFRILLRLEKHT